MIDENIIQDLKNHWRNCNSSTIEFINAIPSKNWQNKPFEPRFRTFSWEFACLLRTRFCYLKGLTTGKLNFAPQDDIPDKQILSQRPKKEVVEQLENLSGDLLKEIENLKTPEQLGLIISLLNHERLHQGKLMLYLSIANLKLPESFIKTWGESNFKKK